ncbi:MAG: orotate phosphoribosyltransferase [Deltaproteobacteria bacterium]|nr:orotate phosphoribosyltransferase [Deltaproteobacteria bacterium]
MSDKILLSIFREKGALLEGHFGLTSGKHSPVYLQCALVLQYPDVGRDLGSRLAERVGEGIDLVVSPAVGGIVIGQEVAWALGARAVFTERVDGKMALRRGFTVNPGERILAVEDVVTTGGSIREAADLAVELGGNLVATASLVHRYIDKPVDPTPYPHFSLLPIHAPAFEPGQCPLCREEIPMEKPGSRALK